MDPSIYQSVSVSLPKIPSFESIDVTEYKIYLVDKFEVVKLKSISYLDNAKTAINHVIGELQIVWNENFNSNSN